MKFAGGGFGVGVSGKSLHPPFASHSVVIEIFGGAIDVRCD
jgi:hypothetical protein